MHIGSGHAKVGPVCFPIGMQRRRFLKAAAATPLIILIPWASFAQLARPGVTFRRVRPSDPSWPGAASWDELNHAVDGNLIKVAPLLAPCSTWLPGRTCLDVLQNARNPFYLGDLPAGTQVSGWLDAWTPEASAFALAIIANGGLPLQALPFYSGYARNRARAVDEATAQL